MEVLQTNRFAKAYKKLHKNQLVEVNAALCLIIENPAIGEQKKGDLSDVFVYKFKMNKQLTLIAYTFEAEKLTLTLLALGSHENFYRDIKRT